MDDVDEEERTGPSETASRETLVALAARRRALTCRNCSSGTDSCAAMGGPRTSVREMPTQSDDAPTGRMLQSFALDFTSRL